MKKIILFALATLLVFALSACTKFNPKSVLQKDFKELTKTSLETKQKLLPITGKLLNKSGSLILTSDKQIYNIEIQKEVKLDGYNIEDTAKVGLYTNYILITESDEYKVFHYQSGKLLFTLPNNTEFHYTFEHDKIRKYNTKFDTQKYYYFYKGEIVDYKTNKLDIPKSNKGKPTVVLNGNDTNIFFENKLYDIVTFNCGDDDHILYYILQNNNIIFEVKSEVTNNEDYDYIIATETNTKKYKKRNYLYNFNKKTISKIKLENYLLEYANNFNVEAGNKLLKNYANIVNAIPINKDTKIIEKNTEVNLIINNEGRVLGVRTTPLNEYYDGYRVEEKINDKEQFFIVYDETGTIKNTYITRKETVLKLLKKRYVVEYKQQLENNDFPETRLISIYDLYEKKFVVDGYTIHFPYSELLSFGSIILKKGNDLSLFNASLFSTKPELIQLKGNIAMTEAHYMFTTKSNDGMFFYYNLHGQLLFSNNTYITSLTHNYRYVINDNEFIDSYIYNFNDQFYQYDCHYINQQIGW